MAAMTALICSALQDLYDLTDAWLWNGLSIQNSLRYLKVKRRLDLFHLHCREVWLRERIKNALPERKKNTRSESDKLDSESICSSTHYRYYLKKMEKERDGFVFGESTPTTEEASDAFETFDNERLTASSLDVKHEYDPLGVMDDIEILSGLEVDTSFYEYYDTTPVYVDPSLNTLSEGLSFSITGVLPYYCERFSINFIINNATKDIALHLNPRLPQNYIVRNTKVKGTWGYEEVSSPLPFTLSRGSPFSVEVLVTRSCYMISVNGHHFAEYAHRLPFTLVNMLEIKGDVQNVDVQIATVERYPARSVDTTAKDIRLVWENPNDEKQSYDEIDGSRIPREWRTITMLEKHKSEELALPYYGIIPKNSLKEGRCLRVEGRVRLLPQSFYINLQQGQDIWPHPNIAFHFNPRFTKQGGAIDKAIVCRNAWHNGSWDEEERSELVTDFRPGKVFSLSIVCAASCFEVYLNKKLMLEFKYRISPDIVDTVYIQGDVKLWDVSLEDCGSPNKENELKNGNSKNYINDEKIQIVEKVLRNSDSEDEQQANESVS